MPDTSDTVYQDQTDVITHPLYLSQSINVQSGLHVAMK